MTQPLNRQQALSKLSEFHSKLSQHLKQFALKKQPKNESQRFIIYQPKHIDSATQTIFDNSQVQNIFKSNKKVEESPEKRAKRTQQLKEIVQVNFRQYFRAAKEKELSLQNDLNEMKHINEQLEKLCSQKDEEISRLRKQFSTTSESFSQPFEQLKKQKLKLQKQHQTDLSAIKNLQKGIDQFQQEVKRLSTLINEKDTEILAQIRKIKELENLYKNSEHLVDVMSNEETVLSAKITKLEKQLKDKNSYVEYVENLYLVTQKENFNLKMEIEYFNLQADILRQKLKDLQQDLETSDQIIQTYENLSSKIVSKKAISSFEQPKYDPLPVDSLFEKFYQSYLDQQMNQEIFANSQRQIFEQTINFEKSILQDKIQVEQRQKTLLLRKINQLKIKHQNFIAVLFSTNLQKSDNLSQFSSSFESLQPQPQPDQNQTSPLQPNPLLIITQPQIILPLEQTPHPIVNQHQISHKQNQLHLLNAERIVSEFLQEEEEFISMTSLKNTLAPAKNLERPPSFGKDHDEMMPPESETSTPNFTEISVTQSNVNSDVIQNNEPKCHLSCNVVDTLQRTQTVEVPPTSEAPNFKITKSQKVSQLISPNNEKPNQEKINCEEIAIQTGNHEQQKPELMEADSKNYPESKEAYCQATKDENLIENPDKQREGNALIKKHESMSNWNGNHQLSPTNQKQQSDCHLIVDRKKNAKKKLEYRLPPLERAKTAMNDLEKQTVHNIQSHNLIYRRVDKEKHHNSKLATCSKLTDRLFELIHKQSNLQLQLSTLEQQQNYQSLGTLGNNSPRETQNQNTHLVIIEELEVMGEVEKIIQEAYEWVMLVDRHHKREFEKNERVSGRIKLKKMKTNINYHKIKQKESNEDCYETDRFFECQKQKSVYSEGDSPPGVGEIDHFDISPFDHIDVQEKHYDNHSLEKLFKEGQEISQISSVKNQSQVSEFINSRSEFVKMFETHHFARVQDEEVHPSVASAYQEGVELNSPNHFYQGTTGLAFNSLAFKNAPHFSHHEHGQHDSTVHQHVRFQDNSIKSLRNICSKEKEKAKSLERKIIEITAMYEKVIEKLIEDDKRKSIKMQKDFNKALSMAINLKEPIMNSHSASLPSNQKQSGQNSNPTTSIKLLPQSEQRPPLPPMKTITSKLQSKSLTEITLLSQKISQKDEILQEKMEAYEKKIDELMIKIEELKTTVNGKSEQIEELEKKNKAEKMETQKVEKRLEEHRKEVQYLKTQNKKIKNEFSQFMSKLVIQHKEDNHLIKFSKKASFNEQIKVMKDIELQVPEFLTIVENLKQDVHSISPPSDASNDSKHESRVEESILTREEKEENGGCVQTIDKVEQASETERKIDEKLIGLEMSNHELKLSLHQVEQNNILSKPQISEQELRSQLQSKEHTIIQLSQTVQQHSTKIFALQNELKAIKQEKIDLNDQIEILSLQLEQKEGELRQLANSLISIQTFEKRLQQKLIQAEEKIKLLQKRQNQHPATPIKTSSPVSNSEHYSTPISQLSASQPQEKDHLPPNSRSKNRRGSMGSLEENFFDLETDNQFNNIETKPEIDKNLKIVQLQKELSQTQKKLQLQILSNQKLKQKGKLDKRYD